MPPKKRGSATATSTPAAPRASKLAKENGINGSQETEIKEAFALFKDPKSTSKDPYMPTPSVRRALAALNLSPSAAELRDLIDAADPEDEGVVSYEAFLGVAALRMKLEDGGEDDEDDENMDLDDDTAYGSTKAKRSGKGKGTQRGQQEEVSKAFQLFCGANSTQGVITFADLKRISKDLKEDVSDDLLRNMMREASGSTRGVNLQDFEGVMRRAGVFR